MELGWFSGKKSWQIWVGHDDWSWKEPVVTTHGFDLFAVGKNDGVVTVASQRELGGEYKEITLDYGHNEVLQSTELASIITDVSSRCFARQTNLVS